MAFEPNDRQRKTNGPGPLRAPGQGARKPAQRKRAPGNAGPSQARPGQRKRPAQKRRAAQQPAQARRQRAQGSAQPGNIAKTATKSSRRSRKAAVENSARQARWKQNRFAITYPTDGPKIFFGLAWFFMAFISIVIADYLKRPSSTSLIFVLVIAPIAGLAGLQIGNTWFGKRKEVRAWTAGVAYLVALSGFAGLQGILIGSVIGLVTLSIGSSMGDGSRRTFSELFDIMFRAAFPVGFAVASMAAITTLSYSKGEGAYVLMALLLLVSAYEAGDFIVGSGANNAIEGPISGVFSLLVVAFALFLIPPAAFVSSTIFILLAFLAAICCPVGQMLGSGLLPNSLAWAPALRRLDSYIVTAPVWLLVLYLLNL